MRGGKQKRPQRTPSEWLAKWWDDWKMALTGITLAARERLFWAWFIGVFFVFGIILNLLSSGTAAFALIFSGGPDVAASVLWKAFLGIFGIGRDFWDFLVVLLITILQATLIATIVVVWKYNKLNAKRFAKNKNKGDTSTNENDPNRDGMTLSGSLQNSGLVAGLALLSGGCPTCGTALLAPIITTVFSGSGFALAGAISGGLTILALALALYTLKKVGLDAHALIKAEKRRKRKAEGHNAEMQTKNRDAKKQAKVKKNLKDDKVKIKRKEKNE